MPLLRLTQTLLTDDLYRAEVALEGDGLARQTATSEFAFTMTDQDHRDVRWYFEDYLSHPFDPAPTIAHRIEARLIELGADLFKAVFRSSDDARDLWATLRGTLNETRMEIISSVEDATAIPWELLRDPTTDVPLGLRAASFVRAQPNAAQRPQWRPDSNGDKIRILLVICRPSGDADVPFRSVSSRILKGLTEEARDVFQLDVLRPATFEALAQRLRGAKLHGAPYHIVHFDGHGTYGKIGGLPPTLPPHKFEQEGKHGYLAFESEHGGDYRDGKQIGDLLVETGVPVLALNACQSAYAEPTEAPEHTDISDEHQRVRAFGSLAQMVMDTGVSGVVAMRYSVYVVTAAKFVAELYRALASGQTLGAAVTTGRKALADDPLRTLAYDPVPLQDWSVPVVYEAMPLQIFPLRTQALPTLISHLGAGEATPCTDQVSPKLPFPPDVGFFGRDETLFALDRAFDKQPIVLLHALAGSGKTTTAAEFARWYAFTGGLGRQDGMVLFTSFERHTPLNRALNDFGTTFDARLKRRGIQWSAIDNQEERRWIVLKELESVPVLWLWDNVEPIAGFPAGTESAWSTDEQQELADFLRSARGTGTKFLLTSRRDERGWLGDLPAQIEVRPMPMIDRVALTKELVERRQKKLKAVEDWQPLLRYTAGNPLTITVLVNQVLRELWTKHEQIAKFVADLRAGEAQIADVDESEGRTKSLAASLKYGFERGFSADEQKLLALLHLFQGFVDVDALRLMGTLDREWTIEVARGLTREAGIVVLDRAAEAGLLTRIGNGSYTIHPALPWYFRELFERYYAAERERAERAYVEAVGELGRYYHEQIQYGNPNLMDLLAAEEDNLLAARRLALARGWLHLVSLTMQGLQRLYYHRGWRADWRVLVEEIVHVFVDPATDLPRPGVDEGDWTIITSYCFLLARELRHWLEAEHLIHILIEVDRRSAGAALALPPESLDAVGRSAIRSLAVSIEQLGHLQRERSQAACVASYEEAVELKRRTGNRTGEATIAFNLGHAYKDLSTIRDLDQAEKWYRHGLELIPEGDYANRAKSLAQLGAVTYERFLEARAVGAPKADLLTYLNAAADYHHQSLDLTPSDAVGDLAVAHNELGAIYESAGQPDRARGHYDSSIIYEERQGNVYGAAQTRYNVALLLWRTGNLPDALLYAQSALRGFQSVANTEDVVQLMQRLINNIQQDMQKGNHP